MAFKLNSVVHWGRSMQEYRKMFLLNDNDMNKKIAGFGDGPASFNYEAAVKGYSVVSFDPIYQFNKSALENRIFEVRDIVMQQMKENKDNYVWTNIQTLDELESVRMSAMKLFLDDYEIGLNEKRYIYHELPNELPYDENTFDIGLSSHFLLMYTALGFDFHIKSMEEMLRVCKEIRIFPLVDLNADKSEMIEAVIKYFDNKYNISIKQTGYEFQKNANRVLIIQK